MMDSYQTLYIVSLGHNEELIRFWGHLKILVTLTLFSRTQHHFEMVKFDKNRVPAHHLLNGMIDSGQTLYIVSL